MTWELMITEGNKQKKVEPNDPAFFVIARPHVDFSTYRISLGCRSELHTLGDAAVAN